MPGGILRTANEVLQLREIAHPVCCPQEFKSPADCPAFRQQLRPFLEQTLRRQILHLDCPAQGNCLRRGMQVEASDELHAPQHAQGILDKLVRHMAQGARRQVRHAAPRIFKPPFQRIVVEGIDRKIATARRFGDRQSRIGIDQKSLVADATFRLAARQRHVDVHTMDLQHAKRHATGIEGEAAAENLLKAVGRDAKDLDIDILDRARTHQKVAHRTADHQSPSASLPRQAGNLANGRQKVGLQRRNVDSCFHTSRKMRFLSHFCRLLFAHYITKRGRAVECLVIKNTFAPLPIGAKSGIITGLFKTTRL